ITRIRRLSFLGYTQLSIITHHLPDRIFVETDSSISVFIAEERSDYFGRSLRTGDLNEDNVSDLLIGAYFADPPGRSDAGKAFLFYGIDSLTSIPHPPALSFRLKQNYPNPFSSSTTIEYSLHFSAPVTLTVDNILGQRAARITQPMQSKGPHSITWNGKDENGKKVASGIYFYRLQAGAFSETKKMILLR
ncbi:MAG: T9SS type A sorting domain-containing protein, partial [Candidatus Latescibacteria bacterium]|nr:T9SS type A sorting domain-containing protein [Candidatus Latescibacterota bacterium]NIM65777.1 T9SS type A sorting domain-containing protein [Candidatus Latescibacterota bacterium]NIO02272.1 T9SS type A sorting domain-containing protein [Candidatus Latescibacterota bacterium]NIO29140.1 T9SS type A sorting domain-containing protein [Candidatus Latescibacterota bacterium]NIO56762.1 T9SS type A sorting domain-containing protein [Candidatus Latescibacterota bacterium]